MKDKNYHTELHVKGFRYTNKFSGFDSASAHFSTEYEPYTLGWVKAQCNAIDLIGEQQTSRGWLDYTVGKTFVQTGREKVTPMCPSYGEGHRSRPIHEEVK